MTGEDNTTLLHFAAFYNSNSCLRVLLRFTDHLLDAVDVANDSPLMYAVRIDNREGAKMLLRGDIQPRYKFDENLLHFARSEEMLEILKQHQQVSGIF